MNTQHLRQFRQLCRLYFGKEARHLLPLLDALASDHTAHTVPMLSLHPLPPYQYRTLYHTIHRFQPQPHILYSLLQPAIPQDHNLYCFGVDTTPYPRPYAHTLADRTFVFQPTPIKGNKPVTIGHEYSLVYLLQRRPPKQPVWTLPLHAQRVPSDRSAQSVACEQIQHLLQHPPFQRALNLFVADAKYSSGKQFVRMPLSYANAVCVVRLRSNSVLFLWAPRPDVRRRGRPRWYSQRLALNRLEQLPPWDAEAEEPVPEGGKWRVRVWRRTLRRGFVPLEGTLLCCERLDAQGERKDARPLWLWVVGERRGEVSPLEVFGWYRRRFGVEHTFRFLKRNLLLTAYQTPEGEQEERWVGVVLLAYAQLFVVRDVQLVEVYGWWLSKVKRQEGGVRSPSQVQRVFGEIVKGLGEVEYVVTPRGRSPGRAIGFRLPARARHKVVRKGCRSA